MTADRWSMIERLYHEALDRKAEDRAVFLNHACGRDDALRHEVESLLAHDGDASFLSTPAATVGHGLAIGIGQAVGPYVVSAPLGEGGMGEVYRARDTTLGRDVAIKVLPTIWASDPERLARFKREARTLAALNHPHIGAIYGVEESAGIRALVLELVEGPTLADRLVKGPLPISEALSIAKQIADALEAAHESGIVHRDLKPANIKITSAGVVKVLDFGLAKAMADEVGSGVSQAPTVTVGGTRHGVILGTAAYMSPEQAKGQAVDGRTDIFAFGCVLYQMLAGRRAFTGESLADTMASVLTLEPDWEHLPAAMPDSIRRLLRRCLVKDRRQRLQAIGEARIVLENPVLDEPAVSAGIEHPRVRPWMVAAAAMAVVAAAASWMAWRASGPVVRPPMNLSVDLGPDAEPAAAVIISPDGSRLVFRSRGANGVEQLSTRLLNQPNSTPLSDTVGASRPFFKPDGQWIGFFADGKLKKVSVQGGAAVTLCDTDGLNRGGSWGEDGKIIFHPDARSGLSRVSDAGGTPQPLTQLDTQKGELTHRNPHILPGGSAVLFTVSNNVTDFDDATIEVLSLKAGNRKVLHRGGFFGRYLPTSIGSGHLVYMHEGKLFAAPMNLGHGDLDKLTLTGPPVPLLEQVANTNTGYAQFDSSPAGTLIYVSGRGARSGGWWIAWLDNKGKTQPLRASVGIYRQLSISPVGTKLAFVVPGTGTNIDIWTYDWQRDTAAKLSSTTDSGRPVWTPDGKGIVYGSKSADGDHLFWIRSDGASTAVPLTESKGPQSAYSFSPDGKHLLYVDESVDTSADIWSVPIDWSDPERPRAGKPEVFLQTKALETQPAFSADGRWVTYASGQGRNQEVYVRPFPANPSAGQWQISSGGGANPIWSHSGSEFFYQAPEGIMVVSYTVSGSAFLAGKPRLWSNRQLLSPGGRNYDVAADGRFAVLVGAETFPDEQPETHVNLLLNFFDEVRHRVPAGSK